jgi:hypothetical protein
MIDLVPHSFKVRPVDLFKDMKFIKYRVTYIVNNVDREMIVMAKNKDDALEKCIDYLEGKTNDNE